MSTQTGAEGTFTWRVRSIVEEDGRERNIEEWRHLEGKHISYIALRVLLARSPASVQKLVQVSLCRTALFSYVEIFAVASSLVMLRPDHMHAIFERRRQREVTSFPVAEGHLSHVACRVADFWPTRKERLSLSGFATTWRVPKRPLQF